MSKSEIKEDVTSPVQKEPAKSVYTAIGSQQIANAKKTLNVLFLAQLPLMPTL